MPQHQTSSGGGASASPAGSEVRFGLRLLLPLAPVQRLRL